MESGEKDGIPKVSYSSDLRLVKLELKPVPVLGHGHQLVVLGARQGSQLRPGQYSKISKHLNIYKERFLKAGFRIQSDFDRIRIRI